MEYIAHSEKETMAFGEALGRKAKKGDIYCLVGDLGVGKTVFTKGFAKGLNIEEAITSPTFTIVNEYSDRALPLYHFDTYRINDPDEMYEIGFEDYLYGEGVCFIEWANLIDELIPNDAIWITIEKDYTMGDDYRKIIIGKKPVAFNLSSEI